MLVGPHTSAGFAHLLWRSSQLPWRGAPAPPRHRYVLSVLHPPSPVLGPSLWPAGTAVSVWGQLSLERRAMVGGRCPRGPASRPSSGGSPARLLTRVLGPRALRGLSTHLCSLPLEAPCCPPCWPLTTGLVSRSLHQMDEGLAPGACRTSGAHAEPDTGLSQAGPPAFQLEPSGTSHRAGRRGPSGGDGSPGAPGCRAPR